jgi:regulator of replication initiation timing
MDDIKKLTEENKKLKEENKRLHERLEDSIAYVFNRDTGELEEVTVEPGFVPDGIACRDETIKLLKDKIIELGDEIKKLNEGK